MAVEWLRNRIAEYESLPAIHWRDKSVTYGELVEKIDWWKDYLSSINVVQGQSVAIVGDHSPAAISLLLALLDGSNIAVPVGHPTSSALQTSVDLAEVSTVITLDADDAPHVTSHESAHDNELLASLRASGEPGIVIFSSGSTGTPKGAVHNAVRFLKKFEFRTAPMTTIAVPPIDHVAGLDTLFYSLSSGGALVCPADRSPTTVAKAIELHNVELLPASPTFLNMLIMSGVAAEFDLSSVRIVAYGSEVMPDRTLGELSSLLPNARLIQKYGTTEFGSPRTRSNAVGSPMVKIESEGVETKIVDGILWLRSESAMMGYLNAPSPFDDDGWLNTEDMVEVEGEFIRILGRRSELINVGGQKVHPAEIENVLTQMDNVLDAVVYGEQNPLMGNVVATKVTLSQSESLRDFKQRLRSFCQGKLDQYKIPVKVEVTLESNVSPRYKKMRRFH
jgi:long-chain acyl-CoA synthetase